MTKIFLDHNSTTFISPEAKKAYDSCLNIPNNPSSIHYFGRQARYIIEEAKKKILASLNLSSLQYEVIFTSTGTEANNLIINSFDGEKIYTTKIEHLSVLNAAKKTEKLEFIDVDNNGSIDFNDLTRKLQKTDAKKLLSVIYANNETGVIQDIKRIAEIAKKYNCIVHTDASQAYGKIPLDLSDYNLDAITISGHKIGAPQGVAALIKRKELKLKPLMHGGGQEFGIRPGTENVPAICAFGVIASNLDEFTKKYNKLSSLRDFIENELESFSKEIDFISKETKRLPNTTSVCFNNIDNNLLLIQLDLAGFAVSAGSACSSGKIEPSYVIEAITGNINKARNTIRVSLGLTNTENDAKQFINACRHIIEKQTADNKMRA